MAKRQIQMKACGACSGEFLQAPTCNMEIVISSYLSSKDYKDLKLKKV